MSARGVDVLVASPDRNFRALARAVLRAAGHQVVATSVEPDRLPRQVRLRAPRVLLLDGPAADSELRRCAAAAGTRIVRVRDGRTDESPGAWSAASKWAPAGALAAAVEEALFAEDRARPLLRLVES